MAKVLVIDDDRMIRETLQVLINSQGHETAGAATLKEGWEQLDRLAPDLIFLDINLPDGSGLDAVAEMRRSPNHPDVIIITGEGNPDDAALAIKSDAWDYVRKPLSMQAVLLPLTRVLQYREEKMVRTASHSLRRSEIIGNSPEIQQCLDIVAKAAATETSVLIGGETGTGKELFARAIHANSDRARQNFVVVDCAALPPTLVESILFGHEKGSFTGAETAREGLLRQAHQGTLFLDEIGELPLDAQKNLLRVLQDQHFRPIGSAKEIESRFRVVAATNRDLEEMAAGGAFRRDLLFRLRGFAIKLPPLRERGDDINELALTQLAKLSKHYRIPIKGVCPGFMETLREYDWPGNVRELFNAVGSAFALARDEPTLFSMHLPADIRTGAKLRQIREGSLSDPTPKRVMAPGSPEDQSTPPPTTSSLPPLQEVREDALNRAERQYLNDLLSLVNGEMERAGAIAGISRSQLYRIMQKHGIKR